MRRLFILITGLLLYGSLYPWQFHFGGGSLWLAMVNVFHQWPLHYQLAILKDMALNVVVYAPLGLTAYLSFAHGFRWSRALWPVAFGFALSLTVETLQSFLPRSPSGMDLVCNTLGTAAGVAIAAAYESALSKWLERFSRNSMRPSSALMMLILFTAHYLMPLTTNAIKMFSVWHQPVVDQHWLWTEFATSLASWWFAGHFVEAVAGRQRWALPFMASAMAFAIATRLISANLLFNWAMLAGAALGVLLWKVCEGRGLAPLYAALAFVWLVGDGLRPYQFIDHKPFDWIPFLGMLGSDWTNAVESLLLKAWMYGTAFWAWERAGLTRVQALAALLSVLAVIEFAQKYLPGRVSTMTDLAMGAIAVALLWSVERKYGE